MNSLCILGNFLCIWLTFLSFATCKEEFRYVTCGSSLKLYNQRQGIRLHSHDVKYGSGSGQQSVTGSTSSDDHNSYWVVKGKNGAHCDRGTPIKCGDKIRLQHGSTKRNLHSHFFQSPITHNQEVSAFGEGGNGDTGDDWEIRCATLRANSGGTKYWNRKDQIRFKHSDTGRFLHASADQFGRPISGQHEICAYHNEDAANLWIAQAGVYIKENKKK